MKNLICFISLLVLPGCSIFMAANKKGCDVSQVQASRTRASLLQYDLKILSSERDAFGCLTEVYLVPKEKGSIVRAFMHGILDMSTCFLWEIVGTPMEGALGKEERFTVRVFYDKNEIVKRMELI